MRIRLIRAAFPAIIASCIVACAITPGSADTPFRSEADLVSAVLPSFVNIYKRGVTKQEPADTAKPAEATVRVQDEVGSGFVVDASGIIATNRHVVDGAYALSVTLDDGRHLPAKLIGKALNFDIALIKVEAGRPLAVAKIGNSDSLRLGDRVVAIGNPLGYSSSISSGVVSALHRFGGLSAYDDLIQTDATINQGNSGGPLFNMSGEVIGMNQAIRTQNKGGSIGIGFAIPINDVQFFIQNVLRDGKPHVGWLGLQSQALTTEMAKVVGLPGQKGVIVASVAPSGPAERAGLQIGDIIQSISGEPIFSGATLNRTIFKSVGQTKMINIVRDGKKMSLEAKILEWPQDVWVTKFEEQPKLSNYADFGVEFADTPEGPTVQSVVENSVAGTAGLKKGDVVRKVRSTEIKTLDQLGSVIDDMFNRQGITSTLLLVANNGITRWVNVSIAE